MVIGFKQYGRCWINLCVRAGVDCWQPNNICVLSMWCELYILRK